MLCRVREAASHSTVDRLPMKTLTRRDLLAAREVRYRRRMNLRITSPAQAVKFVDDVGFCFLFPIQNVKMPSLWDAIAGRGAGNMSLFP
jgi:hypothetical protein